MKHNKKITIVLLAMFLLAQFIGLFVVNYYLPEDKPLPLGLDTPQPQTNVEYNWFLSQIVIAFIIAVALLFFLSKFKIEIILKLWFFVVIVMALAIAFTAFLPEFGYKATIVLAIALILAFIKVFKRNLAVHNITELLVYPGIAAVFVPLLNIWTIIALLVLISIYDMWAVWHSGIMQKMAKYQIDTLKIFSGFFVPYLSSSQRAQVKTWKKTLSKRQLEKKRVRVNVAILGGGDVVFPIITSGVVLKTLGLGHSLFVIFGALAGLAYLFFISEKKKFYPAMPFITAGILASLLVSYIIL